MLIVLALDLIKKKNVHKFKDIPDLEIQKVGLIYLIDFIPIFIPQIIHFNKICCDFFITEKHGFP